jgi:riboflavin synthase
MFTGLVEETGQVTNVEDAGEGKRVIIEADKVLEDISEGDSIDVSGACLTVEEFNEGSFSLFLAEETLDRTWFSSIREGDTVNLERSLTPQDRMGGHYVQGHVDDYSEIRSIEDLEEGWNFEFELTEKVSDHVVEKGFIAVEGISLTVTEVDEESFSVTIIPETWKKTNLSEKNERDQVNLEADIMAKYAEKAVQKRK